MPRQLMPHCYPSRIFRPRTRSVVAAAIIGELTGSLPARSVDGTDPEKCLPVLWFGGELTVGLARA